MTDEKRWPEIDRIFAATLELSPHERRAFLDKACGNDEQLRQEVESLLAHDFQESLAGAAAGEATQLLAKTPEALTSSKIGRYKIIRSLGTGGMGEVYLAHDDRLNRPVAVKLLTNYHEHEEDRVRRFEQEALAASALNHPNILTIYEVGESDGKNFIATEFVDGVTLAAKLETGRFSTDECLSIAIQISSALSAAHLAGIIHRDIKPANLMVRTDGLVKVLDFGIAKYEQQNQVQSKRALVETLPGSVIGTAAYMSPEQARGVPVDVRSDIWSLGVVIYEMITGCRPFSGDTAMDVMSAVIERKPAPFSLHNLSVPNSLEDIVFKGLQKDRDLRYQTAAEVFADLKELKRRLDSGEEPVADSSRPEAGSSIAVLPFINMSADQDNEYFCDGLAEELLNALTKVKNLSVAARTSAFSFKGKDTTVNAIGRALNVSSVLEGSVRKAGNQVRITVQLVNCANGYQLWSERFDREIQDIFQVQDEIALAVVDALKVKLLVKEKEAVLKRYTKNVEAYQLYLKGRYYWWKNNPQDFHKSREFFQRAVEVDPSYALGYCGLSSYYGFGTAWGMISPEVGWPLAISSNTRASELDDTLAEVHNDLAGISMVSRRDWAATEREASRAVELNPKFQEIHYLYSFYLLIRGRISEAISEARTALELDPFSPRIIQNLATCFYITRRYDDAIKQYQEAIELDPANSQLHEQLGDVFDRRGLHDEAIAEWAKAMELSENGAGAVTLRKVSAEKGYAAAVRTMSIAKLDTVRLIRKQGNYIPSVQLARAHTRLGNTEEAFAALAETCNERNVFPLLIESDPFYDSLRSDPRFDALLHRFQLSTDHGQRSAAPEAPTAIITSPATAPKESVTTGIGTAQTGAHVNRTLSIRKVIAAGAAVLLLLVASGLVYWYYANRQLQITSIAVLPFKNESGDNEMEYLSDGMTDSLINRLSQLPNLTVKARSSVFRYKGREVDLKRVASELSVQAVLTGRVVQRGDDLTLNLELVDPKTENLIWSEQYDRKRADLVPLQKEIARDVVQKLRLRLSGTDEQKIAKDYTANAEAYQLYAKGRFHTFKLTTSEIQAGISYFQQAIQLDPNYALAYVGLSDANRSLVLSTEVPPTEYLPRSKEAAEKALAIDDGLAEAHTALGSTIFWYERNWSEADNQYRRALEINPNNADAHLFLAHLFSVTGRHPEALAEIKRARELEPLNPFISTLEGQFLIYAGRLDESLARLQETFALAPNFWFPHLFASRAYMEKGMYPEAINEARRATELSRNQTLSVVLEGCALEKSGKHDEARAKLNELLKLSTAGRFMPPYQIALFHNVLGDREQTFVWLERALQERDPKVVFLKVESTWNNLRSDPKFQDIMRRAGFSNQ